MKTASIVIICVLLLAGVNAVVFTTKVEAANDADCSRRKNERMLTENGKFDCMVVRVRFTPGSHPGKGSCELRLDSCKNVPPGYFELFLSVIKENMPGAYRPSPASERFAPSTWAPPARRPSTPAQQPATPARRPSRPGRRPIDKEHRTALDLQLIHLLANLRP